MTPTAPLEASTHLLTQLVNPAARALALGCGAGLGLAVFRVRSTSVRLFTWTGVLYAALAMPLLGRILPPLPVPTPAFLQYGSTRPVTTIQISQPLTAPIHSAAGRVFVARDEVAKGTSSAALIRQVPSSSSLNPGAPSSFIWSSIRWRAVGAGIYLAVAFIFLARFFVGLACGRRLMQASRTIGEPRVAIRLASRARASGLAFIPQAAESEFISVPVTMGALRSKILLPTGWREWDDAKLHAVIAHEVSHVARRDALTQRLSLLHRAIFWFSPLAWWLDTRLADLAEQASDEAALSCGVDCKDYARTLLGFFEALHATPGRVWWQGVSMAKAGQAEQRVERILAWKGSVAMGFKKSIAAVVVVLAVPAVYLAASAHPARSDGTPQAMNQTQDQAPPSPPPSKRPAHAPKASPGRGSSYAYGYDDEQTFIIASGNSDSLTMSGTTQDAEVVEELRRKIPGDFIWFRRDGKSYIIRDQATVDRARKFWAPQEELGKKQEELGKQQEALGKQQEELGAQMEQVHVKVPDMAAELDKLKAELKQLNSGATMEQVGEIQAEIGELQSRIGELQSQAGEQQSKLGEQMGALGEKQGKLGARQGELGRQQGELAREASRQMKQLLDEALSKGTAQLQQ
jgi:beta-lactamase regulating signal transducer with metallopeptidase domain